MTDPIENVRQLDIANCVRELLVSKGVPKQGHAKKIAEILNLGVAQAHRKLKDSTNWDWMQICRVADYFGEAFDSLNMTFSKSADGPKLIPATLSIENHELPCLVSVGSILHTIKNVDYVASKIDTDEWRVFIAAAAPGGRIYHKVEKLELGITRNSSVSIAVLDDDRGSADNLCEFLIGIGWHAEPFYSSGSLEKALSRKMFDGFVIDWLLGKETAEPLIRLIRSKAELLVPIFLLTGELVTGKANESEVARVITKYSVSWQEKPTRLPIIAAELSKALGLFSTNKADDGMST